jgi:hypothetical protein
VAWRGRGCSPALEARVASGRCAGGAPGASLRGRDRRSGGGRGARRPGRRDWRWLAGGLAGTRHPPLECGLPLPPSTALGGRQRCGEPLELCRPGRRGWATAGAETRCCAATPPAGVEPGRARRKTRQKAAQKRRRTRSRSMVVTTSCGSAALPRCRMPTSAARRDSSCGASRQLGVRHPAGGCLKGARPSRAFRTSTGAPRGTRASARQTRCGRGGISALLPR